MPAPGHGGESGTSPSVGAPRSSAAVPPGWWTGTHGLLLPRALPGPEPDPATDGHPGLTANGHRPHTDQQPAPRTPPAAADPVDPPGPTGGPDDPYLPGPAAERRRALREAQSAARFQLAGLLLVTGLAVLVAWQQWRGISAGTLPPPFAADDDAWSVQFPADVDRMTFEVREDRAVIDVSVSSWEPEGAVVVQGPAEPVLYEVTATTQGGPEITSSGLGAFSWDTAVGVDPNGEHWIRLSPPAGQEPVSVHLALANGEVSESGEYRYVRSPRVEVHPRDYGGLPDKATGSLVFNTGSASVERVLSDAAIQPAGSSGNETMYTATSEPVHGANASLIPVPTLSVDLVDVNMHRNRDPRLLWIGAALGIAGGAGIEMVLTTALVLSQRWAVRPDRPQRQASS